MENYYFFLNNIFVLLLGIQFLILLFNSDMHSIYCNNDYDEQEEEEKEIIKPVIKYEDKYKDKFEKLEYKTTNEDRLENLKNSFIMEMTPHGNVIMFWNHKNGVFSYYSDGTMPYRFLEVVARKYVINYNCKDIYYVMEEQMKEVIVDIVSKKKGKTPSVFAKLKNYNHSSIDSVKKIGSHNSIPTKMNYKPNSISKPNIVKKNVILKENSNHYSCMGRIVNFNFLKRESPKNKTDISFSEYKKLIKS
jgi:hypothetical protein